jgi:alanine racemase
MAIIKALPDADAFGVACIDEAISLREAGFDRRIVLLEGLFGAEDIGLVNGFQLDVVIHHESQLALLEQGSLLRPLDVWVKLDTGMHRLGFAADWVRPGIMLYGGTPLTGRSAASLDLQPVMTLSTRLIAVNERRAGDAIGYGEDWVCPTDRLVGVAAIGYGDGYPRHAPGGTPVLVNGTPAKLAGRVSMDMICIDLVDQPQARVGDEVVLWGEGLPVDEVAAAAGTISYELLCGVGSRVQFEYS